MIRFVIAKVLIGLLYLAPLLLIVLFVLIVAKISFIAAIAIGFIGAILYMAYSVYIWLKLLFVIPDLFLHDRRPMIALNKSFTKTTGFMLQVFVVGIIQWFLAYMGGLASSAAWMVSNPVAMVLLGFIGAIVYSVLYVIKDLFMFYAWEDQKNWQK